MTQVQVPRLEALQNVSDHYSADPYTLSSKVRKRFREEKKVALAKKEADDQLKGRYALPEALVLAEDDEETRREARAEWAKGQSLLPAKRRKLGSGLSSGNASTSLRARILGNTAQQHSLVPRQKTKDGGRLVAVKR
jgi:coiled-coil domain-containing protein 130